MKKVSIEKAQPVLKIVQAIELIVARRQLDKSFHRDEIEKYFNYLIQGKDTIDPYERRDSGVSDESWTKMINDLNVFLGLKKGDKIEKDIFDF